jgi:hypothetical protein
MARPNVLSVRAGKNRAFGENGLVNWLISLLAKQGLGLFQNDKIFENPPVNYSTN